MNSGGTTAVRPLSRSGLSTRPIVVGVPHAGAGSVALHRVGQLVAADVALHGVTLPGREQLIRVPPAPSVEAIVPDLAEQIARLGSIAAIFGHSLGALIAYEVAAYLTADGRQPPALLLSGLDAPSSLRVPAEPLHLLPPADFAARMLDLGGTDPAIVADEELWALTEPALRADLQMFESYRHRPAARPRCRAVVIFGADDRLVTHDGVATWSEDVDGDVEIRIVPGGHFWHVEHPELLADFLCSMAQGNDGGSAR